jgi:hypothetical protein
MKYHSTNFKQHTTELKLAPIKDSAFTKREQASETKMTLPVCFEIFHHSFKLFDFYLRIPQILQLRPATRDNAQQGTTSAHELTGLQMLCNRHITK